MPNVEGTLGKEVYAVWVELGERVVEVRGLVVVLRVVVLGFVVVLRIVDLLVVLARMGSLTITVGFGRAAFVVADFRTVTITVLISGFRVVVGIGLLTVTTTVTTFASPDSIIRQSTRSAQSVANNCRMFRIFKV